MKRKYKPDLIFIFLGVIIVLMLLALGMKTYEWYESRNTYSIPESEVDILHRCAGLGLEDTAECLTLNIKTFYSFNKTKDDISLDFLSLKQRGGDCQDWSYLLIRIEKELGYKTYTKEIDGVNADIGHIFTLMSNDKGYCVIDQTEYWCREYE